MSIVKVKGRRSYKVRKGTLLLDFLKSKRFPISALCGGQGRCGQCKVKIKKIQDPPEKLSSLFIEQKLLKRGYRLACRYRIVRDIEIQLPRSKKRFPRTSKNVGLALDLGTTVIKGATVNMQTHQVKKQAKEYNLQSSFGGDVITRISAALEGKYDILRKSLFTTIRDIKRQLGIHRPLFTTIVGNPVMLSFYLNKPVNGLARHPFRGAIGDGLLLKNTRSYIFPAIGGFVGGDAIAGLLACGFDTKSRCSLYIDLGTNGEVILLKRNKIFATSTAAGPAFEGIGLRCGSLAIPGAIDRVTSAKKSFRIHTINNKKPVGICASGLIDLIAVLLKRGTLRENGRLTRIVDVRGMTLIQEDVRKLQLAIGAIHTGIKILLHKARVNPKQIEEAVITGEFGSRLNIEALYRIGLLPKGIKKISSKNDLPLKGAILALKDDHFIKESDRIRKISKHVDLATQRAFQKIFVSSLRLAPWN